MASQRFQIRETVPGLPGARVCYGCQAEEIMAEPEGDSPAGVLVMDHTEGCEEVKRLTAGGR